MIYGSFFLISTMEFNKRFEQLSKSVEKMEKDLTIIQLRQDRMFANQIEMKEMLAKICSLLRTDGQSIPPNEQPPPENGVQPLEFAMVAPNEQVPMLTQSSLPYFGEALDIGNNSTDTTFNSNVDHHHHHHHNGKDNGVANSSDFYEMQLTLQRDGADDSFEDTDSDIIRIKEEDEIDGEIEILPPLGHVLQDGGGSYDEESNSSSSSKYSLKLSPTKLTT